MTKNDLFQELLTRQRRLDTKIIEKYKAKVQWLEAPELYQKLSVALCVELGEFMNETRVFKFWSEKPTFQDMGKVREEFIDCLHFMLSLSNMIGITAEDIPYGFESRRTTKDTNNIMVKYLGCLHLAGNICFEPNKQDMIDLWKEFVALADYSTLFTHNEDVYDCYMRKNQINHLRQEGGY